MSDQHDHSRFDVSPYFNMISVPVASLYRIYMAPPRNSIYLLCKDYRTIRITLSGFENSKNKVETFVQVLQGIAFSNNNSSSSSGSSGSTTNTNNSISSSDSSNKHGGSSSTEAKNSHNNKKLFAFKNLTYLSLNDTAWGYSDMITEYVRQGLDDAPEWQVRE